MHRLARFALSCCALALCSGVASAATSCIVFQRDYELFKIRADDGSGETRLTESEDGDWDRRPTVCPSGTRIFYERMIEGIMQLWKMNTDGSGETAVLGIDYHDVEHPDCGSNGLASYVFYRSDPDGTDSKEIFRIPMAGGTPLQLTDDAYDDGQPAWCGTGHVVFQKYDGNDWELWIMEIDGGNPVQLTDNAYNDVTPTCTPDGEWVAFMRNGHIYLRSTDPEEDGETNLTSGWDSIGSNYWVEEPAFSPGGSSIVVWAKVCGSPGNCQTVLPNIYTFPLADPNDKQQLTDTSEGEFEPEWGELVN